MSVADVLKDGTCNLKFRRSLIQPELEDWDRLLDILESVHLCEGRDEMIWLLESKRNYSTKSLYRMMTFGGGERLNDDGSLEVQSATEDSDFPLDGFP